MQNSQKNTFNNKNQEISQEFMSMENNVDSQIESNDLGNKTQKIYNSLKTQNEHTQNIEIKFSELNEKISTFLRGNYIFI